MQRLVARFALVLLTALLCALAAPALSAAQAPQAGAAQWGDLPFPEDEAPGTWDDQGNDPNAPAPAPVPSPTPAPTPSPEPTPAPWQPPVVPTVKGKTVKGKVAVLRPDGTAAIPRRAPKRVRDLIRRANQIIGKPYKWGGGHARLVDSGYDCSGAVSYALIGVRLLGSPLVSGSLARWGREGDGRWVSVYANDGHVYLEVAGIRLDTSRAGDWWSGRDGVRWRNPIGRRKGFHARHPAGL